MRCLVDLPSHGNRLHLRSDGGEESCHHKLLEIGIGECNTRGQPVVLILHRVLLSVPCEVFGVIRNEGLNLGLQACARKLLGYTSYGLTPEPGTPFGKRSSSVSKKRANKHV